MKEKAVLQMLIEDKKEMLEILSKLNEFKIQPLSENLKPISSTSLQTFKDSPLGFDEDLINQLLNTCFEYL
jgi:hypothetical protein